MVKRKSRDCASGFTLGFTLVEAAIALIILGVMSVLIATPLVQSIQSRRSSKAKESVAAARDEVLGWVMLNGGTGDKRCLPAAIGSGSEDINMGPDPWGRKFVYVPADGANEMSRLTCARGDICAGATKNTNFSLVLKNNHIAHDVAFVIASKGHLPQNEDNYAYAANPVDVSTHKDDLVEFVTLNQLKAYVCGGSPSKVSFSKNLKDFISERTIDSRDRNSESINEDGDSLMIGLNSTSEASAWYAGSNAYCVNGACKLSPGMRIKAYYRFRYKRGVGTAGFLPGVAFVLADAGKSDTPGVKHLRTMVDDAREGTWYYARVEIFRETSSRLTTRAWIFTDKAKAERARISELYYAGPAPEECTAEAGCYEVLHSDSTNDVRPLSDTVKLGWTVNADGNGSVQIADAEVMFFD